MENSLIVSGIPPKVDLIEVERHFLHRKNGGCGDLESISWTSSGNSTTKGFKAALLQFEDLTTVQSLSSRSHYLKGAKLTLSQPPKVVQLVRVISQKGRSHYYHSGFMYRVGHLGVNELRTFRCVKRLCKARLKQDSEGNFTFATEHNHEADPAELYKKAVMNDLSEMAVDTRVNPTEIIQTATEGLSGEVKARLPHVKSMKRLIERRREKKQKIQRRSLAPLASYGDHVYCVNGQLNSHLIKEEPIG